VTPLRLQPIHEGQPSIPSLATSPCRLTDMPCTLSQRTQHRNCKTTSTTTPPTLLCTHARPGSEPCQPPRRQTPPRTRDAPHQQTPRTRDAPHKTTPTRPPPCAREPATTPTITPPLPHPAQAPANQLLLTLTTLLAHANAAPVFAFVTRPPHRPRPRHLPLRNRLINRHCPCPPLCHRLSRRPYPLIRLRLSSARFLLLAPSSQRCPSQPWLSCVLRFRHLCRPGVEYHTGFPSFEVTGGDGFGRRGRGLGDTSEGFDSRLLWGVVSKTTFYLFLTSSSLAPWRAVLLCSACGADLNVSAAPSALGVVDVAADGV
jgi:hypothetical protein